MKEMPVKESCVPSVHLILISAKTLKVYFLISSLSGHDTTARKHNSRARKILVQQ